jgi:hypothetical protein
VPLGTSVTVTEEVPSGSDFTPVSGSPSTLTITSGVNILTVTNEALGTIEVCKDLVAGDATPNPNISFPFTISDGGVTISVSVPVNGCSYAESVPAGTATVTEGPIPPDYSFAYATGNGSTLLSSSTSNPATYSVPAGGVATETVATFYNEINTGEFKICKATTDPILDNTLFTFSYYYFVNGVEVGPNTVSMYPGSESQPNCSGLVGPIPVINSDGSNVEVYVTEEANADSQVYSIAVQGAGTLDNSDYALGTSNFNLGSLNGGTTIDTYTNEPVLNTGE